MLVCVCVCVCMCVCVVSERQGSALQLQVEQTTVTGSQCSIGGGGGRERTGLQSARQPRATRSQTHRHTSPYSLHHHSQTHASPSDYYGSSSYERRDFYYDDATTSYNHRVQNSNERELTTNSENERQTPTVDYDSWRMYDDFVTAQSCQSASRDVSACAVHSSVIVRRQTAVSGRGWRNSGWQMCTDDAAIATGAVDDLRPAASYMSVIVATPSDAQ